MNLKRFHIYAKNAFLIALAMIVLAGASGLSYKAHYCHGSLAGIAFYTEIGLQQKAGCGCKDDAIIAKNLAVAKDIVIKKKPCCSDISYFGKLNTESTSSPVLIQATIEPAPTAVICHTLCLPDAGKQLVSDFDFKFPPPLLAGRKLVLFLSQQRIPLIRYYC
ncbi:MAG: hypothetical protein WCR72_09905 [Bacteroidota bacterium]